MCGDMIKRKDKDRHILLSCPETIRPTLKHPKHKKQSPRIKSESIQDVMQTVI